MRLISRPETFANCILYLRTVFTNDVCVVTTSFIFIGCYESVWSAKMLPLGLYQMYRMHQQENNVPVDFHRYKLLLPVNHRHCVGYRVCLPKQISSPSFTVILIRLWCAVELFEHAECCCITNHFTIWIAFQCFLTMFDSGRVPYGLR